MNNGDSTLAYAVSKSEENVSSRRQRKPAPIDNKLLLAPSNSGLALAGSRQSLHGVPHQSSTETSGLGETITSGCSSPDSTHSFQLPQHARSGQTPLENGQTVRRSGPPKSTSTQRFHQTSAERDGNAVPVEADVIIKSPLGTLDTRPEESVVVNDTGVAAPTDSWHLQSQHTDNFIMRNCSRHQSMTHSVNKPDRIDMHTLTDSDSGRPQNREATNRSSATKPPQTPAAQQALSEQDFDSLFIDDVASQSANHSFVLAAPSPADVVSIVSTVSAHAMTASALQPSQVDQEWEKRGTGFRSSMRSLSSRGSQRSRSGSESASRRFLGRKTESAWLRWSRERRASVQRRLEQIEKEEQERQRVPTPVKKARHECISFVHPDLEHKYLSEDEIHAARQRQIHEQMQIYYGGTAASSRNLPVLRPELLSDREWSAISGFWYHRTFVNSRLSGSFHSILAFLLALVCVSSPTWITYSTPQGVRVVETLWENCSTNLTFNAVVCSGLSSKRYHASIWDTCYENFTDIEAVAKCPRTKTHWQNAVIGFIIFAASFGFIGSVLSFLGLFTSTLSKKIYYYHSAGEIFLICALTSVIALTIYPVAVSLDETIQGYTLGLGYGLGWGAAFFFVAAALCMSLDEIIREITRRKLCRFCLNRSNDGEESQRV